VTAAVMREEQGKTEGRKARTQARILDAAARLFPTRGYERTSISQVAAQAHVSRAAIFWHFGSKAGLFEETCRRLLHPFFEEIRSSLRHLAPRKRLFELFSVYESFVVSYREPIEGFVRWALESPQAWATLQGPLFEMHDALMRDIRDTLADLLPDRKASEALAAALIATLDGNLLLDVLETGQGNREIRRQGLRRIAELAIGGSSTGAPAPQD
jgi:AcrR family transcriptional regulator